MSSTPAAGGGASWGTASPHLRRRHRKEAIFRACGAAATAAGIGFLAWFLVTLVATASSAYTHAFALLEVEVDAEASGADVDFDRVARSALSRKLPDVTGLSERRELYRLLSIGAPFAIRDAIANDPSLARGRAAIAVPMSADVRLFLRGEIDRGAPESQRALSDRQISWIERLDTAGVLVTRFNGAFFANGDSREPELAGIRGALVGSLLMILVTAALSLPVGVAAAVYLEEFARSGKWTDLVEVNINNLAAVPSIIYGLLGLAVFIDWLGMARSASLVGGLVLSLLTLPVVIISSRAAISAVPAKVRDAALALGASKMQTVFHHVLPLAMPGVLTGAILGLSRALGETAPLLMIGMVAFIVDVPTRMSDPATALPVQIYLWADAPERAFVQQTAAAIVVLLALLLLINMTAILLRKRLERRL